MAFLKSNLPAGILIGVAAGYAAREVLPSLSPVVRPVSKTLMKGAILGYEKVKEAFAHVGESVSDLSYEVRNEMAGAGQERPAVEGAQESRAHGGEEKRSKRRESASHEKRSDRREPEAQAV